MNTSVTSGSDAPAEGSIAVDGSLLARSLVDEGSIAKDEFESDGEISDDIEDGIILDSEGSINDTDIPEDDMPEEPTAAAVDSKVGSR